jgi:hypothetical protein
LYVGDRLLNKVPAMQKEFQIKGWDVAAGIASAGGSALHGKLFVAKRNVDGFDKIDQRFATHKYFFQARMQTQRRPQA